MKPVIYHRLAASELIKSAVFYERQNASLGQAFLSAAELTVLKMARPEAWQNWPAGNPQLENQALSFSNCLPGTTRPILDCRRRTFEPQTRLLDSAATLILPHSDRC